MARARRTASPLLKAFDERLAVRVRLEPNGNHKLQLQTAFFEGALSFGQAEVVGEAIEEFRAAVAADDARGVDRLRPEIRTIKGKWR